MVAFSKDIMPLPGVRPVENLLSLVEQFIESIRRIEYVHVIRDMAHSPLRADPTSDLFDPLRAAARYRTEGNLDEACWLVFLSTHFGKHRRTGWRLTRDVYGALGGSRWSWERIAQDPYGLHKWLEENYATLTRDGIPRAFGNHRKYETLRPSLKNGTGAVVASYVTWILQHGSHAALFDAALTASEGDHRRAFHYLYSSMPVLRFGRTAKFDYLTMLGKLGLASIDPDSAYIVEATGPLRGAQLLFGGTVSAGLPAHELDLKAIQLAAALDIGMQEMEDALCNWQKSPGRFVQFRG